MSHGNSDKKKLVARLKSLAKYVRSTKHGDPWLEAVLLEAAAVIGKLKEKPKVIVV